VNSSGKKKKVLLWSIYTTKSEPILNETDRLPRRRRGRNSAKNCGGRAKSEVPHRALLWCWGKGGWRVDVHQKFLPALAFAAAKFRANKVGAPPIKF